MMLSRRRCMLHEEVKWDYEWYPVNSEGKFAVHKVPVEVGDKITINFYSTKSGYLYDGRDVGLGFVNNDFAFEGGEKIPLNTDSTLEIIPTKSGILTFCGFKGAKEGDIPTYPFDYFTGKYIKVRIERS